MTKRKNPVTNSSRNWRGTSDLTSSIRPIWRSVCHFDVALLHRENRGSTTVMQNRATNLESRYDCHSRTGCVGPEGRKREEALRGKREDSRNRIASRIDVSARRATRRFRRRRHSFSVFSLFLSFFFFLLSHTRQRLYDI